MVGIGVQQCEQVDAAGAAAPQNRGRHEAAVGDALSEPVEDRRQRPDTGGEGHEPESHQPCGVGPQVHAPPDRQAEAHQHEQGQQQYGRVQPPQADGRAEQRDASAAPEGHAGDQAGDREDGHIQEPAPRRGLLPPLQIDRLAAHVDGRDEQAEDGKVGVAEGGPRHGQAGTHRIPMLSRAVGLDEAPDKHGQRCRCRQTEVSRPARHQGRRPGKCCAARKRLEPRGREGQTGKQVAAQGIDHAGQQHDDIEGANDAEPGNEGEGEQVQEGGVVVLGEISRL